MWRIQYSEAYFKEISDLLADGAVQSMRLLPQHVRGVSCYHSVDSEPEYNACQGRQGDEHNGVQLFQGF